MNEQDKKLLLTDLCGRLPYDTIVSVRNVNGRLREDVKLSPYHLAAFNIWDIRPYLRPLSSMTEEEENALVKAAVVGGYNDDSVLYSYIITDWLNANHFDYRGLIPKGQALPAPEGMYGIKTK